MCKKILVVDDDDDWIQLLVKFLTSNGYSVFSAKSSDEAVSVLAQNNIDCIILDAHLGKGDGFELCSFVKMSPELSQIKVVILSGDSFGRSNPAIDAFVCKGSSIENLAFTLERVLR